MIVISRVALIAVVFAAACSSTAPAAVRTVTAPVTVTQTATASASPTQSKASPQKPTKPVSVFGKQYTEHGAVVAITSAKIVRQIPYAGSTKRTESDAEFVLINTRVTNHAKVGMDLTCGYPIVNKLINDADQQYDAIENLYDYPGNPGCNADLQPGFSGKMTYIYRVPTGSRLTGWAFSDDTDGALAAQNLPPVVIPLHIP